jgi:hypothetical protein
MWLAIWSVASFHPRGPLVAALSQPGVTSRGAQFDAGGLSAR